MSSHFSPVDADLANVDWHAIEELLDELSAVAKSGVPAAEFYHRLLERLLPAVAASAGTIWSIDADGRSRLEYQSHVQVHAPHASSHGRSVPQGEPLARREATILAVGGQPRVLTLSAEGESECWQILHPFLAGQPRGGVVELVVAKAVSASAGRNYLRILAAVVEVVEDYQRARELAELRQAALRYRQFDQFAQRAHQSLGLDETAYTIANDGRRVVGCDRLSVLVRRGRGYRVEATSGVDEVERRSQAISAIERLATRAAATGEPLWYDDGIADLPDELQQPLDAYLEQSHARLVAVVPLLERATREDHSPRVIGVLVADHFEAAADPDLIRQRLLAVADHASLALENAVLHSRMPLARVGRALAGVRWLGEARQLPKTLLAAGVLVAVAAALWLIPADFEIEARGELQPVLRREVFAADDGIVEELLVDQGRKVLADEPLVQLRKPELDLESRRVTGEIRTAEKKLAAVRAERLQDRPAGENNRGRDAHEMAAEEEQLKEQLKGLAEQERLLAEQRGALTLRSPIAGQAITWDMEQLLAARPVKRGQALLTVADLNGPWQLELHVADDRAGYVLAARDALEPSLPVTFKLASDPDHEFEGRIAGVALATELDEAQESSLRVNVDFVRDKTLQVRPGATAVAKIYCGRRSLGFVWFHDLYDYLRSLWW